MSDDLIGFLIEFVIEIFGPIIEVFLEPTPKKYKKNGLHPLTKILLVVGIGFAVWLTFL